MIEDSGGALVEFLAPLALLVPFALLIVAVILLRRQTTRPQEFPTETKPHETQVFRAIPTDTPPSVAEPAPVLPKPGRPDAPEPVIDWASRIAAAETAADHAALGELYLASARAEIAKGSAEQAAEHLRASLRAATKSKNLPVQAEARLELAELARLAGDLTTACEHWQIARGLFHKLSDAARLDETERQMRTHRCPTDWVLTDF
ncbi:hypothetical protein [Hyphomicrobium sp. CS1GBMeth3]|uniref:hypothetical protein n=1 Tax=Hyphomicrobium sp. CS1GBMeth3 TaxID=1892845 RepID=UPI000930ED82|nr:hypothetical protein [Hyphomicrobium sp. CS1GBMeth3]